MIYIVCQNIVFTWYAEIGVPKHSHKKLKDSLETRAVLLSSLELVISGVVVQRIHQNSKNGNFCRELFIQNEIETVLAHFHCYDHGAKASEAV